MTSRGGLPAIFADRNLQESKKTSLLPVLKLAEHLGASHRALGGCDADHEFARLREPILHHLGLTDSDLPNLAAAAPVADLGAIAAVGLGAVQRRIGRPYQLLGVAALGVAAGDTEAGGNTEGAGGGVQRGVGQRGAQPLGDLQRPVAVGVG